MACEDRRRDFTNHVFLSEIANQSRIALKAADRLAAVIKHGADPIDTWSAVQLILIAAGNVSKILWPPRKSSALRGEILRRQLDVDDNSPLSDRNFRNHFEHYDERIEDWLASQNTSVYTDWIIGPPMGFARQFPSNVHRGYDYTTQTLTFRGESISLESIVKALDEIRQKSPSVFEV